MNLIIKCWLNGHPCCSTNTSIVLPTPEWPLKRLCKNFNLLHKKKIQFEMHNFNTTPCDTSVNDKLRKT